MSRRNAGRPSKKNFGVAPGPRIQRSAMDRSFKHTTAIDEGVLYPILVDEILPGDTISISPTLFVRLATLLHPIFDNIHVDFHLFFANNRILWRDWIHFMGEPKDPDNPDETYVIPKQPIPAAFDEVLFDYMGLPTVNYQRDVNALPFRAYRKIYDEWFRDGNLQQRTFGVDDDDNGPDDILQAVTLLPRGKRKDYFTSALPWPQAGAAVTLPLGDLAPVLPIQGTGPEFTVDNQSEESVLQVGYLADGDAVSWQDKSSGSNEDLIWGSSPNLLADLENATAATINNIREAFQVQKLLERDARGGRRYSELLLAHFGVMHPDQSWRPEFLGSMTFPVGIFQVPQTSETPALGTPQGNLAAYGQAVNTGRTITKSFTEHGILMGLVSIRADLTYQQGQDRLWDRETRYDYYFPSFAHLGEQEIYNSEIYLDPASDTPENTQVFGYQERYAEYRYKNNVTSGIMRSQHPQSLDTWHLAQDFENLPTLSSQFIEEQPPINRIIAVQDEKHFLLDSYFNYRHVRPMPMFGIPGLVDHF